MLRFAVLVVALVACVLNASAVRRAPSGWLHMGPAPATLPVPVMFLLKLDDQQLDTLLDTCKAVSDPDMPTYGNYLSQREVGDLVGSTTRVDAVRTWLAALGATNMATCATRDCVSASLPVGALADAFGLIVDAGPIGVPRDEAVRSPRELSLFSPPDGGLVVRTEVPALDLPPQIAPHVSVVLGVNDFPPSTRDVRGRAKAPTVAVDTAGEEADGASATILAPVIAVSSFTAESIFVAMNQPCPDNKVSRPPLCAYSGDPIVAYLVNLTVYGQGSTSVLIKDYLSPDDTVVVLNVTTGVQAYEYYTIDVFAVGKSGNMSAKAALDFTHLPAGFRGVLTTPVMTPDEIGKWYGLPSVAQRSQSRAPGASQGVAEFGPDEQLSLDDLAKFRATYGLPASTPVNILGPNNHTASGLESTMDIELILSVAPGVNSTFWLGPYNDTLHRAWVLHFLASLNNNTSPPLVNSISYGLLESLLVPIFGQVDYASRTNTELLKLCARGVTVVVCSQDGGATSDGHGSDSCQINPVFPASSPYATSVGASIQSPDAPARATNWGVGEAAISLTTGGFYTSGGGFSNLESCRVPWYQKSVVANYTSTSIMPPAGSWNTTGRGYPDVAAIGRNYAIVLNHFLAPIGDGTSSSTPVWAGMLSLVNTARLSAGKPPLGFVNPLLYKMAADAATNGQHPFYDITVGSNYCGAFMCCPTYAGYQATAGWDATTGLGSVGSWQDFEKAAVAAAA